MKKKDGNAVEFTKSLFPHRPMLEKIFKESILSKKREWDRKTVEAVEQHGYRQIEIAMHLGLHV